jgi:1-deoxy-D-xylulose-5-phosphate synthase
MDAFPILSSIVQPRDLQKLTSKELQEVADEVRAAIVKMVSQTGGHFSSNLGTVELTVALYAAYEIPPDKVVWDTGHQAYPHKLLTGRLARFDTLRKHKGISGFLKRDEHELDVFGAGHAGTAISAALGFAAARDRNGSDEKVVAVTGDAAICSGMSWEALNHAGELGTDLTVVLNDNRMSIAPNVGALTSYFTRLRSRPLLQDVAQLAKRIIEQIPGPAPRVAAGLRHGLTHYFAPEQTGTIFEEMGWEYIGPVDGHDLATMVEIFRNVRQVGGPVFVHALTVKGKGYDVAEADSRKWHGVGPFDSQAHELPVKAGPVTFTQAFGDALCVLATDDPRIVAITAAMPDGTGLTRFAKEFPKRYYDTGIAEQHAVTFAAGLAAGGQKPFCAIYSTFLQRAYDQVLHDVVLQKLPVRFVLDRAGLVGDDGPTHHGTFDISFLTHMPGMVVCAPRDATELAEMLSWMASYDRGPTAVRFPRGNPDAALPEARTPIHLGQAEVLGAPGTPIDDEGRYDAVVLALGSMVSDAWSAAGTLADRGVKACVVNMRWAAPIDVATALRLAARTGHVITIEENVRTGGLGQQVRDVLVENGASVHHTLLSLPDRFIEHGPQPVIRAEAGLSPSAVVEAVMSYRRTLPYA